MMVCLEKAAAPRIGHFVALTVIRVFGGLGVMRGFVRESQAIVMQLILVIAVESIQLGSDDYDGRENALELGPTCQIAQRGNREASPEVSWESDR